MLNLRATKNKKSKTVLDVTSASGCRITIRYNRITFGFLWPPTTIFITFYEFQHILYIFLLGEKALADSRLWYSAGIVIKRLDALLEWRKDFLSEGKERVQAIKLATTRFSISTHLSKTLCSYYSIAHNYLAYPLR
ncbi:hypothetical protein GQX74_001740, partial [Glossina fuscipes]